MASKVKKDRTEKVKHAPSCISESRNSEIDALPAEKLESSKISITSTRSSSRNRKKTVNERDGDAVGPGLAELPITNDSIQPGASAQHNESQEKDNNGRVRTSTRLRSSGSNGEEKSSKKRCVSSGCILKIKC